MAERDRKLVIAGAGSGMERAVEAVKNAGAHNICFAGQLKVRELKNMMRSARAVIVPSRCYESFGMTVIEACACHTPAIAAGQGNLSELIRDGETGVLFSKVSSHGLREALNRFEGLDREELGRNAYLRYCQEYSPDKSYQELLDIYARMLGDRNGT